MIQNQKKVLRAQVKKIRKSQLKHIKNRNDATIRTTLLNLSEVKNSKSILIYVSNKYEIDTLEIIKTLLKQKKTIIIPKVKTSTSSSKTPTLPLVSLHEITNLKDLEMGSYNILEPSNTTQQVDRNSIDLAIIPGLAFDNNLNRIGYGKGYFDVLLYGLKAKKIALAYDFQIVHNVPVEPHDEKIDIIITENEIIQ